MYFAPQVDFLKLLYDKLLELHLKHADTPEERYFPRPSFKVQVHFDTFLSLRGCAQASSAKPYAHQDEHAAPGVLMWCLLPGQRLVRSESANCLETWRRWWCCTSTSRSPSSGRWPARSWLPCTIRGCYRTAFTLTLCVIGHAAVAPTGFCEQLCELHS